MESTGVVTPEAVALDFSYAGVGSRAVALMLDVMCQAMIIAAGGLIGAVAQNFFGRAGLFIPLIASSFVALVVFPVVAETRGRGQTPGHAIMGLRVLTAEGGTPGLRHAMIRASLEAIEIFATLGLVAVIVSFLSPKSQRLGDLVGATIVVHERGGTAGVTPPIFFSPPPGWEQFASQLDTARLSRPAYSLLRRFLLRSGRLEYRARYATGMRLATGTVNQIAQQPAPGMFPEDYLLCVVAAHQARDNVSTPGEPSRWGAS